MINIFKKKKVTRDLLKHCISVDIETTGLDFEKHSIISLGAVPIVSDECISLYLENYLRDNVEFDDVALKINGSTKEELLDRNFNSYPSEIEALDNLIRFCDENDCHVLCGFNPRFDYGFLRSIWIRYGRYENKFPISYRLIDLGSMTLPILLKRGIEVPAKGISSGFIQKHLGLEKEPSPHNALTGAKYNKMYIEKILSQL